MLLLKNKIIIKFSNRNLLKTTFYFSQKLKDILIFETRTNSKTIEIKLMKMYFFNLYNKIFVRFACQILTTLHKFQKLFWFIALSSLAFFSSFCINLKI